MGSHMRKAVIAASLLVLAGAADAKPKKVPLPPPPPPAPPPVVYIPPRPRPPLNASPNFVPPPLGLDGTRQTVNTAISPLQTTWNMRSAYNVAALNCLRPEHAEILTGYKRYLKIYKVGLLRANRGVDTEFRKRNGAAFIRPREAYMTKVYNFYAFPPTLNNFCDAALVVARESMTLKPIDLPAFSQTSIVKLDAVFANFFTAYEQYRADAAGWDVKYAPVPVVPVIIPAAPITLPGAAGPVAGPMPGPMSGPMAGSMVGPAAAGPAAMPAITLPAPMPVLAPMAMPMPAASATPAAVLPASRPAVATPGT